MDNLIFGPIPYEAVAPEEEEYPADWDVDLDSEEVVTEVPFVSLDVVSEGGVGNVVFNFENDLALTGFELVFAKNEGLEISDFTCNAPFECIFLEIEDEILSVSALVPVTEVEPLPAGQMVVGGINYTGSGTLTLVPEDSTIVDLDFIEYNLLDYNVLDFEL